MGLFKKVTKTMEDGYDRFLAPSQDEVELIEELVEYLREIGIDATALDCGSPEAREHRSETLHLLGYVKIEGQNIDLITVTRFRYGRETPRYFYYYWMRVNVGVLETKEVEGRVAGKDLAWFMPIKKRTGLFRKEIIGYRWSGGKLARLLSADSDLKNTLTNEHLEVMVSLKKSLQRAFIAPSHVEGRLQEEKKQFPSRDVFEAYERIAQYIRSTEKVGG